MHSSDVVCILHPLTSLLTVLASTVLSHRTPSVHHALTECTPIVLIPAPPLQVVTPRALVAGAQGLDGMLQDVLHFLPTHCRLLTEVVAGDLGEGQRVRPLEGYDFVVRSVWPEVAGALEKRIPAVFAAGNPETFYKVGGAGVGGA